MLVLGASELNEEIDETLNTNPLLEEIRPTVSDNDNTIYADRLENLPTSQTQSFEDHIIRQLGFLHLDSDLYVAACIILSCLDDKGYLSLSNQALTAEFERQQIRTSPELIENAKHCIRQLDPAGLASTDLADCFKQQLLRHHTQSGIYKDAVLVCEHLELLKDEPDAAMSQLGIRQNVYSKVLALIKQLDPAPARRYDHDEIVYIQPDILLSIDQHGLSVSINPIINRQIEISMDYVRLLKKSGKPEDKDYLKKNLNSARWWMNALAQRNITLLRVAEHMITKQANYFTEPEKTLRPLTQQTIADNLELHISTVSRAIKDKTIQTPDGIVLLKSLLAGRLPSNKDNFHSNQSVKIILSKLIKNEPSQTPLSDSKIVKILEKRGIRIARRTVNKYREQLNIPASNLRRIK